MKLGDLTNRYGPLIGGPDLRSALGYRTASAFKRAADLGILGVKIFELPDRKGRYAWTADVEAWVLNAANNSVNKGD